MPLGIRLHERNVYSEEKRGYVPCKLVESDRDYLWDFHADYELRKCWFELNVTKWMELAGVSGSPEPVTYMQDLGDDFAEVLIEGWEERSRVFEYPDEGGYKVYVIGLPSDAELKESLEALMDFVEDMADGDKEKMLGAVPELAKALDKFSNYVYDSDK